MMKNWKRLLIVPTLVLTLTLFNGCQTGPGDPGFGYQDMLELIWEWAGIGYEEYKAMPTAEKIKVLEQIREHVRTDMARNLIDQELERQRAILKEEGGVEEPEPEPEPTPTPRPPNNDSEAFFAKVRWLRKDTWGPEAKVVTNLTNLQVTNFRDIRFTPLSIPDWPEQMPTLRGVMCIAVVRDGTWTGGKFEHIRDRMSHRSLINVHNGYIPGLSLRRGERARFWILSYDGKRASNYVEVTL